MGKTAKASPENNIDCPFGELGLVDVLSKNGANITYKKSIPSGDISSDL